jgi:hypothetical protein
MYSTYKNVDDKIIYDASQGSINLRNELSYILNTTGYWVGWRHFDLTKRSQYWDNIAKETIGGPPWEYKDYVFKCRRIRPGRTSLENEILSRFGEIEKESLLYFVPHHIAIQEEDLLFQINDESNRRTPTKISIRKAYEITMLEAKIDGDLIYQVVKAKVKTNINDSTLAGSMPVKFIQV